MSRSLIFWLVVLMAFTGSIAVWSAWQLAARQEAAQTAHVVSVKEPPPGSDQEWITEFTLTERSGKPLGTDDLEGKVWVGSFFFSACPGSCRAQNLHLQALQGKVSEKGVKIVSITCDPQVDTPERLREYAQTMNAKPNDWYFLTGDLSYIKRIGAEYFRVHVDQRGHMDRFVAIDKWGNIRGYYDWHDPEKLTELEAMLDTLLAETQPPENPESST